MSYLDLLCQIQRDIDNDNIPKSEKKRIENLLHQLKLLLWKYSD